MFGIFVRVALDILVFKALLLHDLIHITRYGRSWYGACYAR
jgi:hypothetical protein